jgi:hypothetical protein
VKELEEKLDVNEPDYAQKLIYYRSIQIVGLSEL